MDGTPPSALSARPIRSFDRSAPHEGTGPPVECAAAPLRRCARRRRPLPALRLPGPAPVDGVQEPLSQLRDGLSSRRLLRLTALAPPLPHDLAPPALDLRTAPLPARPRDGALSVLDITEYFGDTSGGIRTYLNAKSRWVASHPEARQVLVVPGRRDALVDAPGCRTYQLRGPGIPYNPPYRLLLAAGTVRRIFEHERPDLIEVGSHLLVPWIARIANRTLRAPLVWFYHGHLPRLVAPEFAPGPAQRVLEAAAWRYVRRLARGCRAVIVASRTLADELTAQGVAGVEQVPLGVDLEQFHPRRRPATGETRRRAGLPDAPLALYAGRFAREKQLDLVLDAWPAVERRTGARLVLLGDGPRSAALRRHPYADRVIWLPFERDRDRLADLLAAVDVYLAPGPYETFGLAALEATASGTPVLSVDRGGVADRVTASGAGTLYPFNDRAGLTAAAISLFQTDHGALGVAGRRFAERHHDGNAAVATLFATYRRLLDRPA